ncbi:hypothetical protein QJS10_CPA05g01012 [Acorus calamus]|uniref:C2 domain-containing protein n=1 Tax=Acorus calamus TaxID=4465 RepID=A0AAV9EUU9_ACOCL|nr:hypothetical protein QJS10_CPA05g01012 [Acorus calamus]
MESEKATETNNTKNNHNSNSLSGQTGIGTGPIGVLEVFIHQARDIHNICIYHKQDVYAKVCLTSDPETAMSTRTINGGGKNPVFNETIRLDVRSLDASLKCEVWMLSRVRNYLEDQLLGFALVPLSEIVSVGQNKLVNQEFSLSSTDIFHTPAGFVQLSISYYGSSPDVLEVLPPASSVTMDTNLTDVENEDPIPCEYEKLEFPDLKIVNETNLLVSEYLGIPCPESSVVTENGNHVMVASENGNHVVDKKFKSIETASKENDNVPSPADPVGPSTPPNAEDITAIAEKSSDIEESKSENPFPQPVISINLEPEQTVVQKDIVDLYMKSMQQFTESLAKMKLPIDVVKGEGVEAENTVADSEEKLQIPKSTGSRPFYGSRAFF